MITFDIGSQASGVFIVKLISGDKTYSQKVVLQ